MSVNIMADGGTVIIEFLEIHTTSEKLSHGMCARTLRFNSLHL